MQWVKRLLGLALLPIVVSCTGGDSAGCATGSTCTATGVNPTAPTVATLTYVLDKASISNSGGDLAVLTITALDAANNVMANIPITVALSSGSYQALASATDASGQVKGNIGIGGDKSNRLITATATGGGVSVTAGVMVTGTTLGITAVPAAPALGVPMTLSVKAADVNGSGISNASIQLSGLGYTGTLTTDAAGNATTASFNAPATAMTYTVTAVGLGVTTTNSVVVGSATGIANVPAGSISAANLSINPNTIAPNTAGFTTSRAGLKAVFRDANNQAIPNVRVRFEVVPPSGSTGEQISTGVNTVYSDVAGTATADYIAGTTSSPTNGVQIRACYGYTDADILGTLCPNSALATMTVASQPLSVTLGSNNTLLAANAGLTYVQTLVVIVNDSAGVAVPNATISGSVDITHYGKGYFSGAYYLDDMVTQLITPPVKNQAGVGTTSYPTPPPPPALPVRIWCVNEDTNSNGFLDTTPNEDINGNGTLDPRKADVTIAFPNGYKTDANGTLLLTVMWPQNVATWLAFTVKVSTLVGGTEGLDQKSFFTTYLKIDEANGSFHTPPYGVGACNSAN